jgi:hypothetical protein
MASRTRIILVKVVAALGVGVTKTPGGQRSLTFVPLMVMYQ